jgi:hypothetical protein
VSGYETGSFVFIIMQQTDIQFFKNYGMGMAIKKLNPKLKQKYTS